MNQERQRPDKRNRRETREEEERLKEVSVSWMTVISVDQNTFFHYYCLSISKLYPKVFDVQ